VQRTRGRHGLKEIGLSNGRTVPADCLAVSGGWSPNVHLSCHQRGRPEWRDDIAAFIPGGELPEGMQVAGSANGTLTLGACLQAGHDAAKAILQDWLRGSPGEVRQTRSAVGVCDVTTKDITLSHQEGFSASEHVKRYTTLGMATDQGKTSNVLGLAVLADATGRTISQTGTTIFRPPWTPVPIAAFAGASRGTTFRPVRYTPSHDWAAEHNAVFVETGAWMRAQWFPRKGETAKCARHARLWVSVM